MNTAIENFIVKANEKEWQPLVEGEIHYKGVWVKSLRYDDKTKRSPTILLKFDAGAEYPYHNHPGGEEIFVLKGSCIIEGAELKTGDYLYTPSGYKHGVKSEEGCVLLLMIPEEVEVL
jgi:quercetin dioxygenase-like cupin family protein